MSLYQKLGAIGPRYISKASIFKYGFNLSPMYRQSTAKVIFASQDLKQVRIKLPISYKNKNYVGSIFGGSQFSAVDPIPMVQLINILNSEYVVWDKSAQIKFKRPAKEDLYAEFTYSDTELADIAQAVSEHGETEMIKTTFLTNKEKSTVYCEVHKTIYIASKAYYKEKRQSRATSA
tara:strand:+ start:72796 stop:73326 length:531 start_codon:yes stop_codon:yes gene_type:complete